MVKLIACVLLEREGDTPVPSTDGRIIGIDLGIKDFVITHDGNKTSKFDNPRHLSKHQKNLKRQQRKKVYKRDNF